PARERAHRDAEGASGESTRRRNPGMRRVRLAVGWVPDGAAVGFDERVFVADRAFDRRPADAPVVVRQSSRRDRRRGQASKIDANDVTRGGADQEFLVFIAIPITD